MFELNDKDLRAIAEKRAARGLGIKLALGLVLFFGAGGLAYQIVFIPSNLSIFWGSIGLMVVGGIGIVVVLWLRERQILKKLREEYSEIIKG